MGLDGLGAPHRDRSATVLDLPAIKGSAPLPNGRQFYGALSARRTEQDLTFETLTHSTCRSVPNHTHTTAYYSLFLAGGYEESYGGKSIRFGPFSSAFTCAGTSHKGYIPDCGTRAFTIEIGDEWISKYVEWQPAPRTIQDLRGGDLTWFGLRLYREYCMEPVTCHLVTESLLWELLSVAAGADTAEFDLIPAWWHRVRELLHSEFVRDLRISEVAQEIGVHPVHLARVFRRKCGQTPGEYLQRIRVRFASEKLVLHEEGIAEIATAAGFADQSHLTRIFKKFTGMTPGEFRRLFAS